MKVFCPNCGTDTEGTPGARANCPACTATFEVPSETGTTRPPQRAEPGEVPPARPVRGQTAPPTQAPARSHTAPPSQAPAGWTGGAGAPMVPGSPRGVGGPPTATVGVNALAIVSLVGGLTCCIPLVSPGLGLGLGIVALRQIEASSPRQGGNGLAIAGMVLGVISTLLQLLWLIGLLAK